ncbi:MAG: GNAT family N-acetyltransferase [Blastocatellia bacterium]|nr:GNAT family N-acetyltransferase [Blastocatellia bacterium]
MEYSIRQARASEIERLREIEQAASGMFADTAYAREVTDEELAAAFLGEQVRNERLWVAVGDGGEPVGFAAVMIIDGRAHLHELSVHPEHGRRGLGRRLTEAVCEWADAAEFEGVTLSTYRSVAWNMPFYERLGFSEMSFEQTGPGLRMLREHEASMGLAVDDRVMMFRSDTGAEPTPEFIFRFAETSHLGKLAYFRAFTANAVRASGCNFPGPLEFLRELDMPGDKRVTMIEDRRGEIHGFIVMDRLDSFAHIYELAVPDSQPDLAVAVIGMVVEWAKQARLRGVTMSPLVFATRHRSALGNWGFSAANEMHLGEGLQAICRREAAAGVPPNVRVHYRLNFSAIRR